MEGSFFLNEYTSDVLETSGLSQLEKHDRRKILRNIWGKVNVASNSYVGRHLKDAESSGYYAAGVLPFLKVWNSETKTEELSVLLVKEQRGKSKSAHLNFLGGKRDMEETPNHTVYREFLEETDGVLLEKQKSKLRKRLKTHHCVMWVACGRYVLKGISCPKSFAKLPETFVTYRKQARAKKFRTKTYGLVWVPLDKLNKVYCKLSIFCRAVCSTKQFQKFVAIYCTYKKHFKLRQKIKLNIKDLSDGKKRKIEAEKDETSTKRVRV